MALSAHVLVANVFDTYVILMLLSYCWSCLKVHATWQTVLIMCHVTNVVMDFTASSLSLETFFLALLTPLTAVLFRCREAVHRTPFCGPTAADRMLLPPGSHAVQPHFILVRHIRPESS